MSTTARPTLGTALGFLLLTAASLLAYYPALRGTPIWDDNEALFSHPLIRSPEGWRQLWTTRQALDFWPLHYTYFWLAYRAWGVWTLPYHLVNILVHAGNSFLFWRLLRQWAYPAPAFFCAALFCLHPVNAEAVAWIVQFKTVASTGLALLALSAFERYLTGEPSIKAWALISAVLFFTAAMLTKSAVAFLPVVLFGLAWRRGRFTWARAAGVTAPFFLVALVLGAYAAHWYSFGQPPPPDIPQARDVLLVATQASEHFWFYLGKALWPHPLLFIYPTTAVGLLGSIAAGAALVACLAASLYAVCYDTKGQTWAAALLYFALAVSPALGFYFIYFMRYSPVADHWQYPALAGVCAGLGALLAKTVRVASWRFAAAAVLLILCFVLTRQRAEAFRSEEAVWRDTLAANDTAWIAHSRLAMLLDEQGHTAEAEVHFRRSLELAPQVRDVYNNYGLYLTNHGAFAAAELAFTRALTLSPDYALAHANLGIALTEAGELTGATSSLEQAIQLAPEEGGFYKNLGYALLKKSDAAGAVAAYAQAVKLAPSADAWNDLAQALRTQGKLAASAEALRSGLAMDPSNASVAANLGLMELEQGQRASGLEHLRAAAALRPGDQAMQQALNQALQGSR